jgi:multiple sugar transport system ATP-binding protein
MTLGDEVAVLKRGVLQQVAPPQELYQRPTNLFVAGFIGSPAMNLVEATLTTGDGRTWVMFGSHRLEVPPELLAARSELARFVDRPVVLGIRPEDMNDAAVGSGAPAERRFSSAVTIREDMGSEVLLHVEVDAAPVLTDDTKELASDLGDEAVERLEERVEARRTSFIVKADPESAVASGARTEIAVDARKLHFFDPSSGSAIYGSPRPAELPVA